MDRDTKKRGRNWYSVSVAAVRRVVTFVGLVVFIAVGVVAYQRWEEYTLEGRARDVIDEATALITQIEQREDFKEIRDDHAAAWKVLGTAQSLFDAGDFASALREGDHCILILKTLSGSSKGSIRVLSVQGSVEYRRGEGGAWRRLRTQDTLKPDDWVKTSTDGTAELLFADSTAFKLRQSTMVHLGSAGGGDRATDTVAFGQVELATSDRVRTVSTPGSKAQVRNDTEALVAFNRDKGSGRFAAFSGSVEVTAKSGQVRQLGALQQVEQTGDRLSEVKSLPGKPQLASPLDDHAIDFATEKEVTLSWRPVPNARRYVLQVANNKLFADNLIEDDNRGKTSARVGIRGEGNFYWQVAAVDRSGGRGPWSDPRSFRVASLSGISEVNDKTPPALEITGTETYGTLVIVNGRTEVGSTVTINDESVVLKSDGSFSKTIQMTQDGWGIIEVVSRDAWNNTATRKVRVFIDAV